jgi:hypothetical protein
MTIETMPNDILINAYNEAVFLCLEDSFIKILLDEIAKRNIRLKDQ